MKLWISSVLAILTGTLAALFIPFGDSAQTILLKYSGLAVNIGRYIIFPLVFFSLAIAVCKLRREKSLFRTMMFTAAYMISATFLLVLIGVIITLIFSPTRISMASQPLI